MKDGKFLTSWNEIPCRTDRLALSSQKYLSIGSIYTDALTPQNPVSSVERSLGSHSQCEILCPFLVILSTTNHTFYMYIKERQMGNEEELGICTAKKI